ncbi:MAG: OmpA family protein, partial [Myxococcales bacterium]|nr:OmpA family protein [Myxococcales bacterium]
GTTDYNLALGQRRAAAVQSYLVSSGVSPGRITLVSYGEERPLASGAGEVAWSQNRRAEFRITVGGDGLVDGTTR